MLLQAVTWAIDSISSRCSCNGDHESDVAFVGAKETATVSLANILANETVAVSSGTFFCLFVFVFCLCFVLFCFVFFFFYQEGLAGDVM